MNVCYNECMKTPVRGTPKTISPDIYPPLTAAHAVKFVRLVSGANLMQLNNARREYNV